MDDITQHSNKRLATILRNPSHPMHSAAKAERDRRMAKREDNDLDEINLKDLSKKIAQSSGNKNLHKAMKPTVDKTKNDLAAMRKRLDALKAGYAVESVELEEGVIDQVKDIVAKKQAKKISGVMVDMFTASAICQIYDKVNDANKAKMDKLPITKLADVAMKMMKKEGVEDLEEMKNTHALVDTADGNKVVAMASSEQGVKQSRTSAERPPMSIKNKNTLKIVTLTKPQSQKASEKMIGRPLPSNMDKFPTNVSASQGKRLGEAKQVLAHGGKGQYKIVSDGGAISVMFKGKVVGKGDFDRGANSFFVSMKGQKGQKSFDDAQDIADYFAKMKIKEEVQIDEVLDTPKAMQSYKDKAKYSRDRASGSAAAKILSKGALGSHKPELDTMRKRHKGMDMVDRNAARKTFKALRKESTQIDEASKEGTIRIIDLGRMGKGKGFQVQRMTKGKFVDQGKPYKSQKDAEKVRKDGQHSMQFEAAPKMKGDWLKKERERNREHDAAMGRTATGRKKPTRTMTSTQKSLASLRKEAFEPHKPEVNEKYKIIHKTMSAALQHAYDQVEKKGYEVDKDDIDNKVAMGPRKPSSGKTNSYNLGLSKNGKPVKQKLHVQVYNMDNKGYELNMDGR